MIRHIIQASSGPADVVADFFVGSGATIKAALELGRQAIGVQLEEERFLPTKTEIKNLSAGVNNIGPLRGQNSQLLAISLRANSARNAF